MTSAHEGNGREDVGKSGLVRRANHHAAGVGAQDGLEDADANTLPTDNALKLG